MRLRFLSPAESELVAAARFYDKQVSGLGLEFLDKVQHALNVIRKNPELPSHISDSQRRCRLRRFPYGLVYQIRPDEIVVASVMHLQRHPDYWKKNL